MPRTRQNPRTHRIAPSCLLPSVSCLLNADAAVLVTHAAERSSSSAVFVSNSTVPQLISSQSSRPITTVKVTITAVFVAKAAASHLIGSRPHRCCRARQHNRTRAESITIPQSPPQGGTPLQNLLWYCGGKSFRGVCARPRASRRLMSHSPNVISPAPAPPPASSTATPIPPHHTAHWLHRADLFLRVIVRLYIGLILVFLPWTRVWAFNRFFLYYAHVSHVMESGAVRGLVSGLGLLNLWIAISEAIHYKES